MKELEAATPVITSLVAEGERQAQIDRQRWEVERQARALAEAEARRVQALKDSREQLLAIVEQWAVARQIEKFFQYASRSARALPDDEATAVRQRLDRARKLLGGVDSLRHFATWRSPESRVLQRRDDPG